MKTVLVTAALAVLLSTTACHTVAGFGRDVSATGHAVTSTARDASH